MKCKRGRSRTVAFLLLLTVIIPSCSNPSHDNNTERLYCQVRIADITPEEPVFLAGFANRTGLSEGIHKQLVTQCLVLKSGQEQVCIIVNDLMEVSPVSIREIKDSITTSTGFSPDNIFVHQTHTHSAPIMDEMGLAWSEANARYRDKVLEIISSNAIQAIIDSAAFIPCRIKTGHSDCNIGISRRATDPETGKSIIGESLEGHFDPEIGILQLTSMNNKPVVTIFNYACHPVTLGYENLSVSPDYVGTARSIIEKHWGGTAIFLNGAAGDINPVNGLGNSTIIADQEGRELGQAVVRAILQEDSVIGLKVTSGRISLPYRDQNLTSHRIMEEVTRKSSEETEFVTWKEDVEKWGERMLKQLTDRSLPKKREMEIGGIRIGSTLIVFSQGEIFNEYHSRLKKSFPANRILF
ncbi:MAG: neutral/alkaline non-lysosomal ceramidase N-terminal domain-containing protein, partial [Bacteroidales bacterium]